MRKRDIQSDPTFSPVLASLHSVATSKEEGRCLLAAGNTTSAAEQQLASTCDQVLLPLDFGLKTAC